MNLTPATYKIIYNNKDITADITDHILNVSYTDKVAGETDEASITVQDSDGLWQNAWYPKKGATLQIEMEQDGRVLNCGTFTIDEIEMASDRSAGDIITIKGIAAAITKKLRTKRSTAHESKSLREIVNTIAAANGLTVQGTIDNITFDRKTQYNKTDLRFLKELADDYGYIFSIRDSTLIFTSVYELEKRTHVLSIDKTELTAWNITDKSAQVYKSAKVAYHNPAKNKTEYFEQQADTESDYATGETDIDGGNAADSLTIKTRVENKQQAEAVAKSKLHQKNTVEADGSMSMPGNPLLVSGNNFELTGMGTLSGINHILTATHTIDRSSSYTTSVEVKRVKKIDPVKWKPKRKKVAANRNVADSYSEPANLFDAVSVGGAGKTLNRTRVNIP